jgi:hypothetical protein
VSANQEKSERWEATWVVALGVPIGCLFATHFGDTIAHLIDSVPTPKWLSGLEDEFNLGTGYLVQADRLAGRPHSPLDAPTVQDIVNSAGYSACTQSLDPDVALFAFQVGGLELYGKYSSIVITIHRADVLLSAAHSASVMMPTVAFEGPVSAARR